MGFKVGDVVVLKNGLKVGESYDGLELTSKKNDCFQSPKKINRITVFGDIILENGYIYSESMLSLYQPKEQSMPRFSFHKLDEGFAFGIWLYFKPFSMHITFARWVFNVRVVK